MAAHDSNASQTITGTGKLQSISVEMKKYGSPNVSVRAKIYSDLPTSGGSGFPLSTLVGQSTNVVAATSLTTSFVSQTFYFNNLQVSGQWIVVFEYESDVLMDYENLILYGVSDPFLGDLYTGGDFWYYVVDTDYWTQFVDGDMVFSCTYCDEATTTTTTTVAPICYLWMLYNEDQTVITWTWTECNGEETEINQEAEDLPIYVCSVNAPTCNGVSEAINTLEVCTETPTTTTTTVQRPI